MGLISKYMTDYSLRYSDMANAVRMQATTLTSGVTAPDAAPHALQGVFDGKSSVIAVDSAQTSVSAGAAATGTDRWDIGTIQGATI